MTTLDSALAGTPDHGQTRDRFSTERAWINGGHSEPGLLDGRRGFWTAGIDSGSTNPIVNYHVIYALSLIVIGVVSAGDTWGAGRAWKQTGIVQKMPWLI